MTTASARGTSRSRSRAAIALTAIAGLVTGLTVAAAAPASAADPPTPDPACVVSPPPASTPILTNLTVSPAAVDVRTGARSVVITAEAQDTVALTSISVSVRGGRTNLGVDLTRVAGTALDGTWRGTLVVPRWASQATYRVSHVVLLDSGAHNASYTPSSPGWGSWSTSFAVTAVPDVTDPRLRGFTASTGSVSTSARAKRIRVRVVMTDGQSGVAGVRVLLVRDLSKARYVDARLTRSAAGSNVWVGSLRVPAWEGAGTRAWRLRVLATDRIGNSRTWTSKDLAARGLRSLARVTSRTDTTKPTIASVALSPTSVDARGGATKLSFVVRVTDPQSGPKGLRFSALRLPVTMTSVTGGRHDKTYTGYVLVPRCGASGTYPVTIEAVDAWGVEHPLAAGHAARTTRTVTVQQLYAGP